MWPCQNHEVVRAEGTGQGHRIFHLVALFWRCSNFHTQLLQHRKFVKHHFALHNLAVFRARETNAPVSEYSFGHSSREFSRHRLNTNFLPSCLHTHEWSHVRTRPFVARRYSAFFRKLDVLLDLPVAIREGLAHEAHLFLHARYAIGVLCSWHGRFVHFVVVWSKWRIQRHIIWNVDEARVLLTWSYDLFCDAVVPGIEVFHQSPSQLVWCGF
jgi:hypothetical protein